MPETKVVVVGVFVLFLVTVAVVSVFASVTFVAVGW